MPSPSTPSTSRLRVGSDLVKKFQGGGTHVIAAQIKEMYNCRPYRAAEAIEPLTRAGLKENGPRWQGQRCFLIEDVERLADEIGWQKVEGRNWSDL
jgi:hypothetical protein